MDREGLKKILAAMSNAAADPFKKCVGCGYCCLKATCGLGLDTPEGCEFLQWNGSRYICLQALLHHAELAIGAGCTSSLNTWRKDVKRRNKNEA